MRELYCLECTIDDDPFSWCDCRKDESCAEMCRWRAHDPDNCPTLVEDPA